MRIFTLICVFFLNYGGTTQGDEQKVETCVRTHVGDAVCFTTDHVICKILSFQNRYFQNSEIKIGESTVDIGDTLCDGGRVISVNQRLGDSGAPPIEGALVGALSEVILPRSLLCPGFDDWVLIEALDSIGETFDLVPYIDRFGSEDYLSCLKLKKCSGDNECMRAVIQDPTSDAENKDKFKGSISDMLKKLKENGLIDKVPAISENGWAPGDKSSTSSQKSDTVKPDKDNSDDSSSSDDKSSLYRWFRNPSNLFLLMILIVVSSLCLLYSFSLWKKRGRRKHPSYEDFAPVLVV